MLIRGVVATDAIERVTFAIHEHAFLIVRDGAVIAWARVGAGPSGKVRVEFDACDGSQLSAAYPSK